MRKAYQLTLNEWEEMLARGPVSFVRGRPFFPHTNIITRTANDYAWIELLPGRKIWKERHATTLLELFLLQAIGDDEVTIDDTIIDADADHIAALPEAGT